MHLSRAFWGIRYSPVFRIQYNPRGLPDGQRFSHHAEYRPNDHQEDAPHFTIFVFGQGIVRSSEFIISDSQTVLPGEVNSASGDVASTMALASFCSNSINESAIAQENSTK